MKKQAMQKRTFMRRVAALWLGAAALQMAGLAHAEDKVTLLSNWYAQAEHGGFYQAVAKGIYKKYGMDVTIKMGGAMTSITAIHIACSMPARCRAIRCPFFRMATRRPWWLACRPAAVPSAHRVMRLAPLASTWT